MSRRFQRDKDLHKGEASFVKEQEEVQLDYVTVKGTKIYEGKARKLMTVGSSKGVTLPKAILNCLLGTKLGVFFKPIMIVDSEGIISILLKPLLSELGIGVEVEEDEDE
jgi:hypothetical protein